MHMPYLLFILHLLHLYCSFSTGNWNTKRNYYYSCHQAISVVFCTAWINLALLLLNGLPIILYVWILNCTHYMT